MDSPETIMSPTTLSALVDALTFVVGEDHSAGTFSPQTQLFGSLTELDSLALVELICVIEERFDLEMDEDDITAEVFESVGSLAAYLDTRTRLT